MTKSVADVIAKRVKRARTTRGWTVRDLAERCSPHIPGLTMASVTNIERARREVSALELLVLAHVLGVHPALLLLPTDPTAVVEIAPDLHVGAARLGQWLTGATSNDLNGTPIAASWAEIDWVRKGASTEGMSMRDLDDLVASTGRRLDPRNPADLEVFADYIRSMLDTFERRAQGGTDG